MDFGVLLITIALLAVCENGEHHMNMLVEKRQSSNQNTPLLVANWCAEDVYPGLLTQGGSGPQQNGFHLSPGSNQTIYVSSNWQGRVWGRSNCTFTSSGQAQGGSGSACSTGDCGGALDCEIAGASPATLAEFTLQGRIKSVILRYKFG